MANVKEMIQRLNALTEHEVRGDLKLFRYLYGEKPVEPLKLEEIKDFSFWDNGQTVLIYSGSRCVYDCNYSKFYGLKRLTTCYSNNGHVVEFNKSKAD